MSATVWREEIRGTAIGAAVMSAFGFVWALLGAAGTTGAAFLIAVSAGISVALIVAAIHLIRTSGSLPKMPSGTMKATVWRRFQTVGIVEGISIGVTVFVLVRLGVQQWIPASVALIVGVHFFLLAALFRVRAYYVTGLLLCAVFVLTSVAAASVDSGADVFFRLPGFGSAFVLWGTAGFLVAFGLRKRGMLSRREPV